jgi:glycosyltransferase involved in cell wall biosynthesis
VRAVPGGGAEDWLLKVTRQMDRECIKFDFCALWPPSPSFCHEVEELGGRVFVCLLSANLAAFSLRFRRILRAGRYDIVHSHVGWPSGLVLWQASLEGIPKRIAHSHNSDDLNPHSLLRNAWRAGMRAGIRKYATAGLACSVAAAQFLFGSQWRLDPRIRVFHCGINLEPFRTAPSREEVRSEIGIPIDAPVVGHVGLFEPRKNQAFLLQVAREVLKARPEAWFLMVGDGPSRPQIESMARDLGIEKNVVFAGQRSDVPRLMLSAMDVFAFPSTEEGLAIVLTEAQAAGLRSVASDAIPAEAAVVPGAIEYLPLSEGPKPWVAALLRLLESGRVEREVALHVLEQTDFNLRHSCAELARMYDRAIDDCRLTIDDYRNSTFETRKSKPDKDAAVNT